MPRIHPAQKLLDVVFDESDIIEIRLINSPAVQHRWCTRETFSKLLPELKQLNADGFNIYYGCNPRTVEGGTTTEHVETARAVFIDMDGGTSADELKAAVDAAEYCHPGIILATGGGVQAIWKLSEPVPVAQWRLMQTELNRRVAGADPTVKDAPRVLRLPGFKNMKPKYGPDFPMAELLANSSGTFSPDDFPMAEAVNTPDVDPENLAIDTSGILPQFAQNFINNGTLYKDKGRRDTAFLVAIEMAAAKIPTEEAKARIIPVLERLGIDGHDLKDASRQIANAYKEARTPTIDPDRLPKTVGARSADFTAEIASSGKHRVVVRVGVKSHIDVLDCSKSASRKRFIKAAKESLQADGFEADLEQYLCGIATGTEAVGDADCPVDQEFTRESFVDVSRFIRPECFTISDGQSWKSGITVPKFQEIDGTIDGMWVTLTIDSDGNRQMFKLPKKITVGANDDVFRVYPTPPPPGIKGCPPRWSDQSMWSFYENGQASIEPKDVVSAVSAEFEKFLYFPDDLREGYLTTLALWVVLTHIPHRFQCVPYILINGVAGSGKGRTMLCIQHLVFRCYQITAPSPAAIYRHIHFEGGTVLCDEAEGLANSELSAGTLDVLLASNNRGVPIPRCDGDDNVVVNYDAFSPKAFISIRHPTKPLLERSIQLLMARAPKGSSETTYHPGEEEFIPHWQRVRDGLHTFVLKYAGEFLNMPAAHDVTPKHMMPRQREVWAPLLKIAAVIDRIAGTNHLKVMTDLIAVVASESEVQAVTESDERLIRALWKLHKAGRPTSPKDILNQAYADGLGLEDRITEKLAGEILRNYGLKTYGRGRNRRWFRVVPEKMQEIAANYSMEIFDEKIDEGAPPDNGAHVSQVTQNPTSGVECDTCDTCDTSNDPPPPPNFLNQLFGKPLQQPGGWNCEQPHRNNPKHSATWGNLQGHRAEHAGHRFR